CRNLQADRDVIGDVITAHGKHATLLYGAIHINHEIGDSATDVDDDCSELLLILLQYSLRGRKRVDDDVSWFQFQFLHTTNRILNPCPDAVHNMKIRLQFPAQQSNGVQYAVLSIDIVVLNNRVKDAILHRQTDLASIRPHIVQILLVNFLSSLLEHNDAPV